MNRLWFFLFLYGTSAFIGAFLCTFWTRVMWNRRGRIVHPWWHDRALVLALAIACVSGGMTVVDFARVIGNAQFGLSPILTRTEGYFIAFGLLIGIIGLFKMTWLADLEEHPPRWTWLRCMVAVTLLWAVLSRILAAHAPFGG